MDERNRIPKFDLAEQIMAEQRKNASVRRKGPGKQVKSEKKQPGPAPVAHVMRPRSVPLGQDQVIAEIVARDIDRLCRSTG